MKQQTQNWLLSQACYYLEYQLPEKSIVLLEALRAINPHNSELYRILTYAYLKAGNPEKALKTADLFLTLTKSSNDYKIINWLKGIAKISSKKMNKKTI